jgi:hypothetical protein
MYRCVYVSAIIEFYPRTSSTNWCRHLDLNSREGAISMDLRLEHRQIYEDCVDRRWFGQRIHFTQHCSLDHPHRTWLCGVPIILVPSPISDRIIRLRCESMSNCAMGISETAYKRLYFLEGEVEKRSHLHSLRLCVRLWLGNSEKTCRLRETAGSGGFIQECQGGRNSTKGCFGCGSAAH